MRALLVLSLALLSSAAQADYSFVCGKDREKGFDKAELALVQSAELDMKVYVNGKELPRDQYEVKSALGFKWYVTRFVSAEGATLARYEFTEKPASVQEFKPGEKSVKAGAAKPCILTNTNLPGADPEAAPPPAVKKKKKKK